MTEITQENFRALLPGKIAKTAEIFAQNQNCSQKEALLRIYYSPVYSELEQESSKLWWESPLQLYKEFNLLLRQASPAAPLQAKGNFNNFNKVKEKRSGGREAVIPLHK